MNSFGKMIEILSKLRDSKIYYTLRGTRDDAISIDVSVPGQIWEIDFLSNETIEIEIYKSDGKIHDETILDELFKEFSD